MIDHADHLLIGAGPGCLQLAYELHRRGADYLVLEAAEVPGAFFQRFPRHRTLISINKPHVGDVPPGPALRYDWNSLLSDDESARFTRYSPRYFPAADDFVRYLADFTTRFELNVRYGARVARVRRGDGGHFEVSDEAGRRYTARRLIVGTGFGARYLPAIPGIEHAEHYWDFGTDPHDFTDLRVLVIGKGNSAFETADGIVETAATTHLCSPSPVRFAWKTRYVGHLRAVNNNFLDTYHLKSQNAVLDAEVTNIAPADGGGFTVDFAYTHAAGERIRRFYDRVLACTGFRFDDSIFAPEVRPASCLNGRYPAQTTEWESTNVPGLHFVGTLMHARDYRRTMSGFIHGFRYNARFLADLLHSKDTGEPLRHQELAVDVDKVVETVLDRINTSSAMFLQPGYLCDVIAGPDPEGTLRHYPGVPFDYAFQGELGHGRWYAITLDYGPEAEDPFFIERDTDPSWARFAPFLHPIVRAFNGTTQVGQLHLLEDLENHYDAAKHGPPLRRFFADHLGRVDGR